MSIFSAQNAGGVLLSRERIQPTFGATFHDFSGDSENVEIFFLDVCPIYLSGPIVSPCCYPPLLGMSVAFSTENERFHEVSYSCFCREEAQVQRAAFKVSCKENVVMSK